MIYLKKGQTLFDNPGMVVYDPTGYYDDGASVICSPAYNPEEPACRYEAKYVAYGGIVYSVSNEEELMKQILEIDPNTLFGKDSKEVAIDKVVEGIVVQETSDSDEIQNRTTTNTNNEPTTTAPSEILPADTFTSTSTPITNSTSTPPAVEIPVNNTSTSTSTTTPADILSASTSTSTPTSTPPVVEAPINNVSASTSATTTTTESAVEASAATPPIDLIVDAVSALTESK